jgi:hypothetical protein
LLPTCAELAFSTEVDFVTRAGEPPDGNPIISDGDLLGLVSDATGVQCVVCARNVDLLGSTFDVPVDLGLDAADVIDAEGFLVAFSTELNSPNQGQFTAGDLLATDGTIIPNTDLTAAFWQVNNITASAYDIGLDAVHFVGEVANIKAFLAAWPPGDQVTLAEMLVEHQIDIWFSTEGTLGPVDAPVLLDGDLVSARDGTVVASNDELLPASVLAGIPNRGVDFGLDAVTSDRVGEEKTQILFSTEILNEGDLSFTDGDVLRYNSGVVHTNADLVSCFEPAAGFLGLDALHVAIAVVEPSSKGYLPLIQRQYR